MPTRLLTLVLLLSSPALTQNSPSRPSPENQNAQSGVAAAPQPPSAQASPDLAQMRDDLNRMESLNMNMSSEIEFLRDQNLQILLRTNSQMWTVLIHDLRRQIEREEQGRGIPQAPPRNESPAVKSNPQ